MLSCVCVFVCVCGFRSLSEVCRHGVRSLSEVCRHRVRWLSEVCLAPGLSCVWRCRMFDDGKSGFGDIAGGGIGSVIGVGGVVGDCSLVAIIS